MSIVDLIVHLFIWGLVFYVLWWALGKIAPPEPFGKIIMVLLVVGAVYVVLGPLFGFMPLTHFTLTR